MPNGEARMRQTLRARARIEAWVTIASEISAAAGMRIDTTVAVTDTGGSFFSGSDEARSVASASSAIR
ncbi:MAG: hypothetical protein NVSMB26_03270 [Beijerinckiaceae bacterium]